MRFPLIAAGLMTLAAALPATAFDIEAMARGLLDFADRSAL